MEPCAISQELVTTRRSSDRGKLNVTQQTRDQVIPLDLSTRDTERRGGRTQLVGIYYFSPNLACSRHRVVRIF